ncbi:hypothetical protein IC614_06000 [Allosphingosinicella flava]|uniref:Uncharacterized protein n=1 Tax=Allosphingosinicella flava TaxID=2771430 RepID=A0A7T2GLK8_9SPHN|nr:hypothetical protein [Sphingosinicella flava]QPQ56115.1 hypothetical protein IC614_06000 [Sphingosinicella flava]
MNKLIAAVTLIIGLPAIASSQQAPAPGKMACCEEMKAQGKECCCEDMGHGDHAAHGDQKSNMPETSHNH